MINFILKYKFPFFVLVIAILLIGASFVLKLEKEREQRIIYERILAEQKALKERERRAELKLYLMGKFEPSQKEGFVSVPDAYSISGYKMYLRKETLDAFLKMAEKAKEENIDLKIASATRNFAYQKNLWNNKWTGYTLVENKDLSKSIPDGLKRFEKILEYSAAPSTSRHHWGSDIDINNANKEYFETKTGEKVYEWLEKNASAFGFCQPYNQKRNTRTTGYNEEKWHWSYAPLAKTFTQEYKNLIQETEINGFMGDENVSKLNLINDYVLGINPECI